MLLERTVKKKCPEANTGHLELAALFQSSDSDQATS